MMLNDRFERGHSWSRLSERLAPDLLAILSESYVETEAAKIEKALRSLAMLYRNQVGDLHLKYRLTHAQQLDLESIEIPLQLLG